MMRNVCVDLLLQRCGDFPSRVYERARRFGPPLGSYVFAHVIQHFECSTLVCGLQKPLIDSGGLERRERDGWTAASFLGASD
jgi:hypothetical protein